jgi:hypothetical protein
MEPRWNKISAAVVEGLEAAVAIEQNKIILLEIADATMKDQKVHQQEGEGKIEFANRQAKFEQQRRDIPVEIENRSERLQLLMTQYEEFLKGNSVLGSKTGPIVKLESLFNRGGANEGAVSSA